MRQNDLLKSDAGDHLRVLLYGEQQSYVVNCQRCKMPFPISTSSLLLMEKLPQDMYRLLALDEDISERQRQQRDRRAELIAPLLVEECICDKSYRNKVLREIVSGNSVSRKTVLQYLWLYWVYQSKNALLPAEKSNTEKRPLSSDEKTIRWALNKFYYTPQKQSLQTAYKMMLHAKYCDAKGKLKPDYPSFWQFRYYFRQHRDPISESISREGIKAYQRNHRPFIGAVSDYAGTIGTYMTDATVADIYMASAGIMPTAAAIWSFCAAQDDCPVSVASDPKLLYALLPRADGKITQRGLELFNLRFSNSARDGLRDINACVDLARL